MHLPSNFSKSCSICKNHLPLANLSKGEKNEFDQNLVGKQTCAKNRNLEGGGTRKVQKNPAQKNLIFLCQPSVMLNNHMKCMEFSMCYFLLFSFINLSNVLTLNKVEQST